MSNLDYLKSLLKTSKFDDHPELKSFFETYERKLEIRNSENLHSFLVSQNISFEDRSDLTPQLNQNILKIEKQLQHNLSLHHFTEPASLQKLFCYALKFIPPFEGFFLKPETAQKILKKHPQKKLSRELGSGKYDCHNPLFLLSLGRYAELPEWNETFIESLSNLTPDDFEWRTVHLHVVNHASFTTASQNIIQAKCFNTHDKLIGAHLISTVPDFFDLSHKAPALRTLTKMIHYHKEMELFSRAFSLLAYSQKKFGIKLSQILNLHKLDTTAPLFNTFEVIEGLANREINLKICHMAVDYPELEPWSLVHNIAHLLNEEFISLSLWRLTAWHLNGKHEHTIKMYKDDILADMLIEKYGLAAVEQATIHSLAERRHCVLTTCNDLISNAISIN